MTDNFSVDYQAVLADLEARRTAFNRAIDSTIAGIRQILAASGTDLGDVPTSSGITASAALIEGGFLGMSLVDAAKKQLRAVRRKQTNREIADALEAGGFVHTSKEFVNTVGTALWRSVQNGDPEIFRQGRYWLLSE